MKSKTSELDKFLKSKRDHCLIRNFTIVDKFHGYLGAALSQKDLDIDELASLCKSFEQLVCIEQQLLDL